METRSRAGAGRAAWLPAFVLQFATLLLLLSMGSGLCAEPSSTLVGPGPNAAPGLGEVEVPTRASGPVAMSLGAGYAFTEALEGDAGAHHRAAMSGAAAVSATQWLMLGARLRGQYDVHPADAEGSDDSYNGLPMLAARAFNAHSQLGYGFELRGWFPGQEAPSIDFGATTIDLVALGSYTLSSGLLLAANLGYRLDNSAAAAPELDTLRQGDRISLDASEHDALLLGLGGALPLGELLPFAELSAELSPGAEQVMASPMRAGVGVRYGHQRALQLEGRVNVGLSQRTGVTPSDELLRVEPRFGVHFGLAYTFGVGAEQKPDTSPQVEPTGDDESPIEDSAEPKSDTAPASVERQVGGKILTTGGDPLAQVDVTMTQGDRTWQGTTDAEGRYVFPDVPPGKVLIRAETVDYDPASFEGDVVAGEGTMEFAVIEMKLQALHAQIQGLVRSFNGEPLQAKIVISPSGQTGTTDEEGRFAIDVNPGKYTVKISATGHATQTRNVTVSEKGVVVVNADLRKAR